jgi:protein-tyrosine phosphatase
MTSSLRYRVLTVGLATALTAGLACAPAIAAPSSTGTANSVGLARKAADQVIPFTSASVSDVSNGQETISWTVDDKTTVQIWAGDSADSQPTLLAVQHGSGSLTVDAPADGSRTYFRLDPNQGGALVVASRDLGLASDPNLRDGGEYRTQNGQWVRAGAFYRSQQLTLSNSNGTAATADRAVVDGLGIGIDADLRMNSEVASAPDYVPAGATYQHLNVMADAEAAGGSSSSSYMQLLASRAAARQTMIQTEVAFVDMPSAKTAFHDLLTDLATSDNPVLYHCTAGKDRTGWASAVLLTLLGVDSQTVMNDYLLSNQYYYNSPAIQAQVAQLTAYGLPGIKDMMLVDPAYLQAGLDRVTQEYGSMQNYAINGLGLSQQTIDQLKAKFLVGAPTS